MPRYIMLIGLPASGKSTWRQNFLSKMENRDDWAVISGDDILEEYAERDGITYSDAFQRYSGYSQKEMKRRFKEAVNQGKNIIHDQTNMSKKSRRGKLKDVSSEYECEAVVFSVSDALLNERLNNRPGKEIPKHVIDGMARSYEAPSKDEGFSKISYVKK